MHVLSRAEDGLKADLVRELGGTYHAGSLKNLDFEPDTIIECTGVGQVIAESIQKIGANGIICLAGIGHGGAATSATIADIASSVVLQNNVIVGSVNANNGTGTGPASILPVLTARGCLNSLPGANNRRSS